MRRVVACFVVLFGARIAVGQDKQPDRVDAFTKEYESLIKLQDLRGVSRIVARDKGTAEDVLNQYSFKFAQGELKSLDDARPLAAALDDNEGGKRCAKRFDLLQAMNEGQHKSWLEMRTAFSKAMDRFVEARQKKEPAAYRLAISEFEEVDKLAEKLNDNEIAGYVIYHQGVMEEELGEDYQAVVKLFDKGIDLWKAGERAKNDMYQHMVDKRRELIEKGFDPNAKDTPKQPDGQPARKNSTTSYKEGAEWQDWETEYKEMKDPFQLGTTSPWNCEHLLLWREFSWAEDTKPLKSKPFGALVQAQPFGKPLALLRDGVHGFFDLNNDNKGDVPAKVIDGKPTLNSIKSGEGKDADQYAFFMLSGGSNQYWFQIPVNMQHAGRYRVGCYREGKLLGENVVLLDDNSTGVFGDPSEKTDNLLRGYPTWWDNDGLIIGHGKPIPWSDVVEVGGKWFHFKPADSHGKKMRTRELDIQTGQVVLKWNGPVPPRLLVLAEVRDFKGCFFDVSGGKPVTVPVGRYEIAYGVIETGKGAQMKQAWIFKGDSKAIDVKAGDAGPVTLDMGAPYTFDVETGTEEQGKLFVVKGKTLLVKEKSGAIVGRIFDDVPLPEVAARIKGGSSFGKPETMKKIDAKTFNTDNNLAWFPLNLTIEKPEKTKLEVQLTLSKPHPLLGGPFKSEWK